jgi:cadmium resistance protein CadD (predicted permease)
MPAMAELLALVVSASLAFAATNIDDILILTVLFGLAGRNQALGVREVVAGQYLGFGALVGVSAIGAFGLLLFPDEIVGLLGLIPLTLGVRGLLLLCHRDENHDPDPELLPARHGALGVAGITFANGADNIAIYVPFFASAGADGMAIIAAVFAVLVAVWCLAGRLLGTHPVTLKAIDRYGQIVVPVVLVALGAFILTEAGTLGEAADLLGF